MSVASLFVVLHLVSSGYLDSKTNFQAFMFLVSFAHAGGLNAVVGHELLHRRETVHKVFGTLAYSVMLYSHFFVEHIRGHHKHVATPRDPASSNLNESLWSFLPRSMGGSYLSVWNYEKERLSASNISTSGFSIYNRMISFNIAHVIYLAVIFKVFGGKTVLFHLAYSFIATCLLEIINYIEHYGLSRT